MRLTLNFIFVFLIFNKAFSQFTDSLQALKKFDSLMVVSNQLIAKSNLDSAMQVNAQALTIAEQYAGTNSMAYSQSIINRGWILLNMGRFPEAESSFLSIKKIQETISGKEHRTYLTIVGKLAILYSVMGDYERAESVFLESVTISKKILGSEHASYAANIENLAILYRMMGQFSKAEPLFIEAMEIQRKKRGSDHPIYANSCFNLANLYLDMGLYEKAEPLFLQAKEIDEKVNGKEHPDFAHTLNSLATLYFNKGEYGKAEPLFQDAKRIRQNTLGTEHPEYSSSLLNLATLYGAMGRHTESEELFLETKNNILKTLGNKHPNYATCINDLGNLYLEMKHYEKGKKLLMEAKEIREMLLGNDHPDVVISLRSLSKYYMATEQYNKVGEHYIMISMLNRKKVLSAIHHLSEYEIQQYLETFENDLNNIFSFGFQFPINSDISEACYNDALFYKGFLLHTNYQVRNLINSNLPLRDQYNVLKSYSRKLAAEYSKPITERKGVSDLEEKANTVEKELARLVTGYSEASRQVKWQDVQTTLTLSEAAVEFVSFEISFPLHSDSTLYAALIMKPGNKQPVFIPLFEEKSLDSLLHSKSERKADYVNNLYTLVDRGAIAVEAPKKSLYELIWKPLEKELAGIKTIYFSPSGLLHRINLDAIPISETETLADRFNLVELNSTRQLVIPTLIKNTNNDAVLFGGILFEQDTTFQNNEPLIASRSRGELFFNLVDTTLRGGSWNYLAGTEREVNAIERMMQTAGLTTRLNKGYLASEESFKNIGLNNSPSPRILHIATHGYFFPDPKESRQSSVVSRQEEPVFKMSEHPMLRSGLIMAGGNAAWQGKQTLEGREDGILTAYEISQMNLCNTELVVLSACETGLGDIQGNEGVYGLQRAFKIAGAKYLIMSLWQVPDKQTSLLMTTFYKKWLEEKMSIQDAFHAAQKELRDNGLDPYNWAGFVLVE